MELNPSNLDVNPLKSAKVAGLRYVSDRRPGIRRVRTGAGFKYVGPDGRTIKDRDELQRIRSLAVPPAWTDVWICPLPDGHLQAVGRDARGRKQYRYHPRWRVIRDETKFDHLIAFGKALPKIRRHVKRDLRYRGLPKQILYRRLAGVLTRRGFDTGVIVRVLHDLLGSLPQVRD